ncbi:MAG: glycosyltransferase family 2 protein [Planctomycetes bacterium]|nr:glycosyltransferase family 2 protein [Planctomycetota bacterium]
MAADTAAAPAGPTPISGCIISYQEADRIADCVRSLGFCSEVVVVDSGSTDGTRELAASLGARVVTNAPFPGHREQKQFAVEQAAHRWVFCLDADERATPELQAAIQQLAQTGLRGAAYEMPRKNHYLGAIVKRGLFWPDRKLRLFDRTQARWGGTNPHDRVEVTAGGAVTRLDAAIEHLSYRDFRHHLRTIDSYTRIAARALAAEGRRANPFDLLVRPPSVFVKSLLVKRGFVDGWRGLVIASTAAYCDWLKYWRLYGEGRARRRS